MSYVWTPSIFKIFCLFFFWSSEVLWWRLDLAGGSKSAEWAQPPCAISFPSMLFLGHCLASLAGEFPSSPGVTELQEWAAGRRRRKVCFPTGRVTPMSLGPKTRVCFVRSRSHPRHAHSWDTWWHKRGGSFRQVLEFSFASFLIVGIPP